MKGLKLAVISEGDNILITNGIVLDTIGNTTIIVRAFDKIKTYAEKVSLIVANHSFGRTSIYEGNLVAIDKDNLIIEDVELLTDRDRRRSRRHHTNLSSMAFYNGDDFCVHVEDMSESGLAITSKCKLKISDEVFVQMPLRIDGENAVFSGKGHIARIIDCETYGLEFVQLSSSNLFTLKSYIGRELS